MFISILVLYYCCFFVFHTNPSVVFRTHTQRPPSPNVFPSLRFYMYVIQHLISFSHIYTTTQPKTTYRFDLCNILLVYSLFSWCITSHNKTKEKPTTNISRTQSNQAHIHCTFRTHQGTIPTDQTHSHTEREREQIRAFFVVCRIIITLSLLLCCSRRFRFVESRRLSYRLHHHRVACVLLSFFRRCSR